MDPTDLTELLLRQLATQNVRLENKARFALIEVAEKAGKRFAEPRLERRRGRRPYVFLQEKYTLQEPYQGVRNKREELLAAQAQLATELFAETLSTVARSHGHTYATQRDVTIALGLICPLWPIC